MTVWSLFQKIVFRFVTIYFVLFAAPFPLGSIPGTGRLSELSNAAWSPLVRWVAKSLFHVDAAPSETGSGDATYDYVKLLCIALIAMLGTLAWSIADRHRPNYQRLYDWIRTYVRFYLGVRLIEYGLAKVFLIQFSEPPPIGYLLRYGDSSPMGLLWTFMAVSKPYCIFTGVAELINGLLLCFRRTVTLGALLGLAIMSNVVMLNLCYDVPVKILSSHMLLMSLFLALPSLPHLANLLIFRRPTDPTPIGRLFEWTWLHRSAIAGKWLFVLSLLFDESYSRLKLKEVVTAPRKHPLYGVYEVESFETQKATTPWQYLQFAGLVIEIRLMDGESLIFLVKDDPAKREWVITLPQSPEQGPFVLRYTKAEGDRLLLEGSLQTNALRVRLKRRDISKLRLLSRGFHWINEEPYNL